MILLILAAWLIGIQTGTMIVVIQMQNAGLKGIRVGALPGILGIIAMILGLVLVL